MNRSRRSTPAGAGVLRGLGYSWGGKRVLGLDRALLVVSAALGLAVLAAAILASAPAQAAFPGLNGRIFCPGVRDAFGTDSELFSVNPDGTGETVLTNDATRDGGPAISPDGTKIAFESQRDNVVGEPLNTEIYVADNDGDLTGSDVKRLTFNKGLLPNGTLSSIAATDFSPTWSPDGTQIAFHSGRAVSFPDEISPNPTRDFEIYKISTTVGEDVTPATRLTVNRGQDAIPSWSPDGTKIAFQRIYQPPNPLADPLRDQNLEVWTMNPDGTGQTNVSNNPGTPDVAVHGVSRA